MIEKETTRPKPEWQSAGGQSQIFKKKSNFEKNNKNFRFTRNKKKTEREREEEEIKDDTRSKSYYKNTRKQNVNQLEIPRFILNSRPLNRKNSSQKVN